MAPLALVPFAVNLFPRSRWLGGQECFQSVLLLTATHGLFEHCVVVWLTGSPPAPPPAPRNHRRSRLAIADVSGYHSDDEKDNLAVVPYSQECTDATVDPPKDSKEYNEKAKLDAVALASSGPRATLVIITIVNKALDCGLKDKMYLSGDKWAKTNDARTADGFPRQYRISTQASNRVERIVARKAVYLFLNANGWVLLLPAEYTLKNRTLAFRMLARQAGALFAKAFFPHEGYPYKLFKILTDESWAAEIERDANKTCPFDDFALDHVTDYPNVLGHESKAILVTTAEGARTETPRSECGHSFWQRECRLRSIQTHQDDFSSVNASVLLHTQRRIETIVDSEAVRKPLGRPKKKAKPKAKAKAKPDKKKKKKNRLRFGRQTSCFGGWGAWRLFLHIRRAEYKPKFGPSSIKVTVRELSRQYRALSDEAKADLRARGRAMTHARSMGPMPGASAANPTIEDPTTNQAVMTVASTFGNPPHVGEESSTTVAEKKLGSDLATLGSGNPSEATYRLNSILRTVAQMSFNKRRGRDVKLQQWTKSRTESVSNGVFDNEVAVDGLRVVPANTSIDRFVWRIPAIAAAKQCAAKSGDPGQQWSGIQLNGEGEDHFAYYHRDLRAAFETRSKMIKTKDQPKLGPIRPSKQTASLCRALQICLHDRPMLAEFRSAFLSFARTLYVKKEENKVMKMIFENGFGVLRLEWTRLGVCLSNGDPEHVEYYHASHTNQHTWAMSLLPLYFDDDRASVLAAKILGHVPLKAIREPVLDDACPFAQMGMDTLPRQFDGRDFTQICYGTAYALHASDRELSEFIPRRVEVKQVSQRKLVWPGSAAVLEAAKKTKKPSPGDAHSFLPLGDAPHGGAEPPEDGGGGDPGLEGVDVICGVCGGGGGGDDEFGGHEEQPAWLVEAEKAMEAAIAAAAKEPMSCSCIYLFSRSQFIRDVDDGALPPIMGFM